MIHSMTGFGKSEAESEHLKITVELRSVNSKQADVYFRIPNELRFLEMILRKEIATTLLRGKIDLFVRLEMLHADDEVKLDEEVLRHYWTELQRVSEVVGVPLAKDPMQTILQLPGAIVTGEIAEIPEEELEELTLSTLREAMNNLQSFRAQEGEALAVGFMENIGNIRSLLEQVAPYEEERITDVRQRLEEGMQKYLQVDYDRSRLEQEMIYYIEKLDINEEKSRLSNHLKYFEETLKQSEPGQGRKLGFIAQEIGREVNTLGSKSNHAEMQKLVVKMKDELEQIKEQVLNVL
ncbi:MAG: YicC/YloC family endoribonuclease [Porphyromonas sp.]|nr:YicC/YloC family endoribonuclease [Porphyromonas sp.]